jgi:murein DD-endopeptidase
MTRLRLLPPSLLLLLALGGCAFKPIDGGQSQAARSAADTAVRMVGKPYRYGGSTPAGFDCSGLVYYSYARAGVSVPRNTDGLRRATRPVSHRDLRPGDLLFFDQNGRKASHVGIYLGNSEFVHAPSTGRHVYIANFEDDYWQRYFVGARRVDAD